MAGNFWQSSHYSQWILEKVDLLRERQADFQAMASADNAGEKEYQKVIIFFCNFMQTLGEQLK